MDTLNETSPYWNCDPRGMTAIRNQLASAVGWDTPPDESLMTMIPSTLLPVLSPDAYARERPRSALLANLPFLLLPDIMWMRRPGEAAGAWQMRVLAGMDRLGLIVNEESGEPWYANVPDAPDSTERAFHALTAFDGGETDEWLTRARTDVLERATALWPDGYPLDEERRLGEDMASASLLACPVLCAQRALAVADGPDGNAQDAVELLKSVKDSYGGWFDADDLSPRGVRAWMLEHRNRADAYLTMLVRSGLESQDTLDAWKGLAG